MLETIVVGSELESAQSVLKTVIVDASSEHAEVAVGFRGGTKRVQAFWCPEHDLWVSLERETNRFWNAFGIGSPFEQAAPISISVEINPPLAGLQRRVQGVFARDDAGSLYLLHRGGIGGGRKGIGKTEFLRHYTRLSPVVNINDGRDASSSAIVVAVLVDPAAVAEVSAFVHSVARFKHEVVSGVTRESVEPAPGYRQEFVGTKTIPAREEILVVSRHGAVVDRLWRLLEKAGYAVANDRWRDLFTKDQESDGLLFEVKSSSDRQSLYTAVGQLMIHSAGSAVRRIAVIPSDIPLELRADIVACGIEVLLYDWKDGVPTFNSIESVLASPQERKNGA